MKTKEFLLALEQKPDAYWRFRRGITQIFTDTRLLLSQQGIELFTQHLMLAFGKPSSGIFQQLKTQLLSDAETKRIILTSGAAASAADPTFNATEEKIEQDLETYIAQNPIMQKQLYGINERLCQNNPPLYLQGVNELLLQNMDYVAGVMRILGKDALDSLFNFVKQDGELSAFALALMQEVQMLPSEMATPQASSSALESSSAAAIAASRKFAPATLEQYQTAISKNDFALALRLASACPEVSLVDFQTFLDKPEVKAHVNTPGGSGCTALYFAINVREFKKAKLLLSSEAIISDDIRKMAATIADLPGYLKNSLGLEVPAEVATIVTQPPGM